MSKSSTPQNDKQSTDPQIPILCEGGCNFYGSPETKNCCSLCFKKLYPKEFEASQIQNKNDKQPPPQQQKNKNANDEQKDAASNDDNADKELEPKKPKKKVQKKKNRCWGCRKKISLAGQFECKCGYVFCSMHRYPDAHECDFDYKKQQQKILEKQNQKVAFAKFEQI